MNFETWLRNGLASDAATRRRAKKIQRLLDMRPGRRRERLLNRLERHAAVQLAVPVKGTSENEPTGVDWSQIDWKAAISKILEILLALIPLFLL